MKRLVGILLIMMLVLSGVSRADVEGYNTYVTYYYDTSYTGNAEIINNSAGGYGTYMYADVGLKADSSGEIGELEGWVCGIITVKWEGDGTAPGCQVYYSETMSTNVQAPGTGQWRDSGNLDVYSWATVDFHDNQGGACFDARAEGRGTDEGPPYADLDWWGYRTSFSHASNSPQQATGYVYNPSLEKGSTFYTTLLGGAASVTTENHFTIVPGQTEVSFQIWLISEVFAMCVSDEDSFGGSSAYSDNMLCWTLSTEEY